MGAQRIGTANGVVNALRAECLLASGAAAAQLNALKLPADGGWYPRYIAALIKDRNGQSGPAADLLAALVKTSAKGIHPEAHANTAVQVLRRAVAGLLPKKDGGRPFASAGDAGKAAVWLRAILALDKGPGTDDVACLALTAVQLNDAATAATLDTLEKRITARADPGKGYAALGAAYRLALELAANKGEEPATAQGERCRRFALRWRPYDLEEAAKLYAQAVRIEAKAAFDAAKPEGQPQAKYRVFERALVKADDALYVPTVVAKLAFAWTWTAKTFPASAFAQAITEGQKAVQHAAAQQDKRRRGRHGGSISAARPW